MSSISHLTSVSLILMLTSIGGMAYPAQELVTLTMTERAGVSREAEWITIGVPLPKGKTRSTDELYVLQNGQPLLPSPWGVKLLLHNRWLWSQKEPTAFS